MTVSNSRAEKKLQVQPEVRPDPDQHPGLSTPTDDPQRKVRFSLFGVIGISVLGLIDMAYLTRLHWQVHSIPGFKGGFCPGGGDTVDCDAVAASSYSVFIGVPVSFWGVLAYLALIGLAFFAIKGMSEKTAPKTAGLGLLAVASVGSIFVAALLGYISHVYIDSYCSLCMFGYVFNAAIMALVFFSLYYLRTGPIRALIDDLVYLAKNPGFTLPVGGLSAVIVLMTIALYPEPPASAEGAPGVPDMEKMAAQGFQANEELAAIAFCIDAPHKGVTDAPVVIVEFTDYLCPFCRRTYVAMKEMLRPYEGRYRVIHRHFPLDGQCNSAVGRTGDGSRCVAVYHAICAAQQGLFWELNDKLFSAASYSQPVVRQMAEDVGCDMGALDACLESELPKELLARDTDDATKLGLRGTPTFFINGVKIVGMPNPQQLELIFKAYE